jgi:hypothetical protein
MTAALPEGYSSRPPQLSDAEALFELISACNTAVIGFADFTLDDMADELSEPFALDAAAGRSGTILHVDTNNPTPALGLYLSVGMRATLVIDVWRRKVATR